MTDSSTSSGPTADDEPDRDDRDPKAPPTIAEVIGGPWGLAESGAPAVAFIAAYTISGQDTTLSAIVAVAFGVITFVTRLIRRESPRNSISGLVGVLFAAFIATRSGKAENFFLPGLLFNVGYATAFIVSVLIRRPLVGYIVGMIDGEGTGWREDPLRVRVFMRASLLWAGLFIVRLIVQLPLYAAGAVVALGIARTAMGLPLFALGVWLTYRLVRQPPPEAEPEPA